MLQQHTTQRTRHRRWWFTGLAATILLVGMFVTWQAVARADQQMRAALMQRTSAVASRLPIADIKALSGTATDLDQPAYLRLKGQLSAVLADNDRIRFAYLMGRTQDGALYFLVDDRPVGHPEEAPAGMLYEDAPAAFGQVLDTGVAQVAGPFRDRWGSFVSGCVPITDPQTKATLAILAIDLDTRAWKRDLASQAALPVGMTVVALIVMMTLSFSLRPSDETTKPVRQRLMLPLAVLLLLVMVAFSIALGMQQDDRLTATSSLVMHQAVDELSIDLDDQAHALAAMQSILLQDPVLRQALAAGDREWLLAQYEPVFARLKAEYGVTHFYFSDAQRVCLVRVHNPAKDGDLIDRFTAQEAERTGAVASGIELGPLGTFTLRVVQPVMDDGALIGYLELGKEVEDVLASVHHDPGVQAAVTLEKGALNRAAWESGMAMLGREAEWGRFADDVLIYSSLSPFPAQAEPFVGQDQFLGQQKLARINVNGTIWHLGSSPLHDASGAQVGSLMVMNDITAAQSAYIRVMAVGGAVSAALLSALFAVIWVLLTRTDREIKAQQIALQESEQRFRSLFMASPVSILIHDKDSGEIVDANQAAWEEYGLSSLAELQTHEVWMEPPYSFDEALAWMQRAAEEGPQRFTWLSRARTGELFWRQVHLVTVSIDGIERVLATTVDITELKQAQAELDRSREQFALAVHGSNDGIWDWDLRDNSLYLSPTWKEQLGYTDQELDNVFATFENLLHPDDKPRVLEYVGQYLKGNNEHYRHEFRMRQKSGQYRWMLARGAAIRDAEGIPYRLAGSHTDITALKQDEEAIKLNERRLESLLRINQYVPQDIQDLLDFTLDQAIDLTGSGIGYIYFYDQDRQEFELNTWSQEVMAQCSVAEPQTIYQLKKTGIWGEAVRQRRPIMVNDFAAPNPLKKGLPEGHAPLHRFLTIPVFDKGQIVAVLGVANKTTDYDDADVRHMELVMNAVWKIVQRKRDEEHLIETNQRLVEATARANQMAQQAEMANIAKSEFLANMSHEIRTPMNGVIGMTGLLLDTELDDEQRRFAEIVQTSAESLLGLINDILDFSKIEAGKLDLETLDFDLASVLDDLATTLAMRAHEKGLEFLYAVDPRVPTLLRGDPSRLRQILTNLVSNAIKFTPAGEVSVRVSLLSHSASEAMLRFVVRDTGIGIPKDKLILLFDKFSQVDASTTRQYGGSGLGLAISKQLAEMLGGEIGVESKAGQGSEFWFTARLGIQEGKAKPERLAADLKGVRVLVVDDNATNREILEQRMSAWGMRFAAAQDGPGALGALWGALADRDPFRLAVIDMQMPGMDGEALGRAIKADTRLAETCIVMLTSLGERTDGARLAEVGFAACLTKPVRHQELERVLAVALAGDKDRASIQMPVDRSGTEQASDNLLQGRQGRILLAEDNIVNQQVALGMLRKLGLRADAVANGLEVIRALESIPYDLVLMDVQMPEMDGLDATQMIRDPQSAVLDHAVVVIAMTASAMQGDRERCLQAGMDDYISKPVMPRTLVQVLDKWLPQHHDRATAMQPAPSQAEERRLKPLAPQAEESDTPTWARESFVSRLMNDQALVRTVMAGFLADIPQQMDALQNYMVSGDMASVDRQAHTIKGAAANVGGERLRAVAFEMETAARAGNLSLVQERMQALRAEFEHLRAAMEGEQPSL